MKRGIYGFCSWCRGYGVPRFASFLDLIKLFEGAEHNRPSSLRYRNKNLFLKRTFIYKKIVEGGWSIWETPLARGEGYFCSCIARKEPVIFHREGEAAPQ